MRTVVTTILAALIGLGGLTTAATVASAAPAHRPSQVAPAGLRWDVHTNGVSWD